MATTSIVCIQCFQNTPTYLAIAVSYEIKEFMKQVFAEPFKFVHLKQYFNMIKHFENENNCWNNKTTFHLQTTDVQILILHWQVVHFFNDTKNKYQLKLN